MGIFDGDQLVKRVKSVPYYKELFQKAYGSDEVTISTISMALKSFLVNFNSFNSKFDQQTFGMAELSPLESRGQELFDGKYNCKSCHFLTDPKGYNDGGDPFPGEEPGSISPMVNIGLDAEYADAGFGKLTGNPADNGKFKIPNLRNIVLTAPYMHDGRFKDLNAVLDHYSHGIANNPNLDSRLKDAANQPVVLNITEEDKRAIIAFLATLTDNALISDPKLSNPFKVK